MNSEKILLAGAARADITPEMGTQIDGDIGRPRPMKEVREPIFCRTLVLEQEGRRGCILSMDLLAVNTVWGAKVRDAISQRFGIDRSGIAVHVTQTHSAPSLGEIMLEDRLPVVKKLPWLRGIDNPNYCPFVLHQIEKTIEEALKKLEPVRAGFASVLDGRVAFNRRTVMRDGTSEMMGKGRPHEVLHVEGPADPEVGTLAFTNESGKHIAVAMHHTSHPTHGYPHNYVHPDWPGVWCNEIEPDLGGGMPMVINGCCGNVHHRNIFDPTQEDTAERMGALLAESTRRTLQQLSYDQEPQFNWKSEIIELPFRGVPEEEFERARKLIEEHPEPFWQKDGKRVEWAWCYAAAKLDLEAMVKSQESYGYEIQAFRIGDAAVLVLPGEPFVEGQLEIKMRSPFKRTYVAHMANQYAGYIPTPRALRGGGYETDTCMASKFAPEALGIIADESVRILNELAGAEERPSPRKREWI